MKKKLIVVLGMHRSGTSVITRGLQVLGVDLGDNLLPPMVEVNAKGFWEDIDINALNIEMLNVIGSEWHHLSPIKAGELQLLRDQGYIQKAVDLLQKKAADIPIFGFKDPRVAKLILFWKEVFNLLDWDVGYVLSIRNPLSVVKSLAKRDSFDAEMSYLLWLDHVIVSLAGTVGEKRILIDYDRLMQAPEGELQRMSNAFGLQVDAAMMSIYLQEFLDSTLQHTLFAANDLLFDDTCPQLVREIFPMLLGVAMDRVDLEDSHLQAEFNRWCQAFESLSVPMQLADNLYRKVSATNQCLVERNRLLQTLGKEHAYAQQIVAERDTQLQQLNDQLKILGENYGHAQVIVLERDAQLKILNDQLKTLGEKHQQAQAIVAERDIQLQALNDQLQSLGKEHGHAQSIVAERDTQLQTLNDELQSLGKEHGHAQSIVAERDKQLQSLNNQLQTLGKEYEHAQTIVVERDTQLADQAIELATLKKIKQFLRIR